MFLKTNLKRDKQARLQTVVLPLALLTAMVGATTMVPSSHRHVPESEPPTLFPASLSVSCLPDSVFSPSAAYPPPPPMYKCFMSAVSAAPFSHVTLLFFFPPIDKRRRHGRKTARSRRPSDLARGGRTSLSTMVPRSPRVFLTTATSSRVRENIENWKSKKGQKFDKSICERAGTFILMDENTR